MTFGGEIQRLRKKKGLKQYELAEKLGFKSAYLCHIENGKRKPQSNKFIENVCEALELTDKERKHLYELSYNLPKNITNKKQEFLSQIANMELRDQLEAKEQMIKDGKESISRYQKLVIKQAELLTKCREWLIGISKCPLPPRSTKEIDELIKETDEVLK